MGVRFVARMVDSLADPPRVQFPESEPTWIAEPDWIEYFGLMISAHHGITVEALGLPSFETTFRTHAKQSRDRGLVKSHDRSC